MEKEKKINYFKNAASLCDFGFSEYQVDLLTSLYDLVLLKEGGTTIDEVITIKYEAFDRDKKKQLDLLKNMKGRTNMSNKQRKAGARNWLKARLLSVPSMFNTDLLTEEECSIAENILEQYDILMANWDNQSKLFSQSKNNDDEKR